MAENSKGKKPPRDGGCSQAEKLKIEKLLAEYQACNMTRDHYDYIVWLIGTIFIGATLTLFGLSFQIAEPSGVALTAVFSMLILGVWIAYYRHVNPYIWVSFQRALSIEDELKDIKLYRWINGEEAIKRGEETIKRGGKAIKSGGEEWTKKSATQIRGVHLRNALIAIMGGAWGIRVLIVASEYNWFGNNWVSNLSALINSNILLVAFMIAWLVFLGIYSLWAYHDRCGRRNTNS